MNFPIPSRRARAVLVSAAVLVAALASPALAQTTRRLPTLYRFDKGATYQSGCFDPCLCPTLEAVPVRGTFVLTPAGSDGLYSYFKVTGVNWTVAMGDPELRITGSGTYRVGGEFALEQRLELDLQVGDHDVQHFDSRRVVGPAAFPVIDLIVSINGVYCLDTVIKVTASPVPADQIHPYRLIIDSTFQRGCFDPCDCLTGDVEPLAGTFALVHLQDTPLFREFAVVDVRWRTTALDGTVFPVRGFGTYKIGGEVALTDQLSLDLTVGNDPLTHYDSGLVPGGAGFPRIRKTISINGGVCYDTVMKVDARPRRGLRALP